MNIHYTKIKQAFDIGCYMSVAGDRIRIFWPQRAVELFGATPDEVLREMRAIQDKIKEDPDYRVNGKPGDSTHINGIAKNGAIAYKEGTPASDCPYLEESDDFARWNDQWDEAADKAEEEAQKPEIIGSVVTNRYRAQYAEMGHPTHCGDELAVLINNLCSNKAGTNLEIFEAICAANGVGLGRYKRHGKGWQGRLRMTGRNLLSKQVIAQRGKLNMPAGFAPDSYQLTEDWLFNAERKYKPKVEK